jgi:hypothetical protein
MSMRIAVAVATIGVGILVSNAAVARPEVVGVHSGE